MKFVLGLVLLAVGAHAMTIVTVSTPEPKVEASVGGSAELKCEFDIQPNSTQPPTIAWFKGNDDFRGAERIYTGHKVWGNETQRREDSFGDYIGRVEVADLDKPAIKISGIKSTDFARYWCTVAEWGVRTEFGVDAKSVLLTETGHSEASIDISVSGEKDVDEGGDVEMTCRCHGCTSAAIFDWFKGPAFAGSEWVTTGNYTHIAAKVDVGVLGFPNPIEIDDGFGQFSVTPSNSLRLTGAQVADAGRYWCKVTSGGSVDIKATVLKVKVPEFTCAGKADGHYPDPEDCAMYYQCLYGFPQPFHRPCGYAGMVFNPEHLYCDWAFNVGPPCGSKA
ncbi:coxsackievirus and adenovirus receptor homolog [Branchiostoma floridae]|uniref:chitinase n=2 Tax=Branchiostoma floridae TaxID=7739 RepID=A0A9J7LFX5_BRAFL|nr:coxsackievirus and adenovirus receptor homolog [Branchiostoma floridae]